MSDVEEVQFSTGFAAQLWPRSQCYTSATTAPCSSDFFLRSTSRSQTPAIIPVATMGTVVHFTLAFVRRDQRGSPRAPRRMRRHFRDPHWLSQPCRSSVAHATVTFQPNRPVVPTVRRRTRSPLNRHTIYLPTVALRPSWVLNRVLFRSVHIPPE